MMNLTYQKMMVSSIFALQSIAYLKIVTKPNTHSTLYLNLRMMNCSLGTNWGGSLRLTRRSILMNCLPGCRLAGW